MKKKIISFTLDIEVIERLNNEAAKTGISNSSFINNLLHEKFKTRSNGRSNGRHARKLHNS